MDRTPDTSPSFGSTGFFIRSAMTFVLALVMFGAAGKDAAAQFKGCPALHHCLVGCSGSIIAGASDDEFYACRDKCLATPNCAQGKRGQTPAMRNAQACSKLHKCLVVCDEKALFGASHDQLNACSERCLTAGGACKAEVAKASIPKAPQQPAAKRKRGRQKANQQQPGTQQQFGNQQQPGNQQQNTQQQPGNQQQNTQQQPGTQQQFGNQQQPGTQQQNNQQQPGNQQQNTQQQPGTQQQFGNQQQPGTQQQNTQQQPGNQQQSTQQQPGTQQQFGNQQQPGNQQQQNNQQQPGSQQQFGNQQQPGNQQQQNNQQQPGNQQQTAALPQAQGLAGIIHRDLGVTSVLQLDGANICMFEKDLETIHRYFTANGMQYEPIIVDDSETLIYFQAGGCDVVFVSQPDAAAIVRTIGGPGTYMTLPETVR